MERKTTLDLDETRLVCSSNPVHPSVSDELLLAKKADLNERRSVI